MFGMCSFLTRMEIFSPALLYLQVQVRALGVLLISEICSILLAIKSCSLRVMEDIKEFFKQGHSFYRLATHSGTNATVCICS